MLHHLLSVTDMDTLMINPWLGASWEGFAMEQLIHVAPAEVYFWSTYSGAELIFFSSITAENTALKSSSVKTRKSAGLCVSPSRTLIWSICGSFIPAVLPFRLKNGYAAAFNNQSPVKKWLQ
ncbi:MAG: hypothetical protein U5K27_02265 [Desulfotignum sp.]|nr:hypothetical protein [Desulfotignum sp.]